MRILLTGASGFIGSHTARILLEQGHDIYVIVRPGSDTWRIVDILSDLHVITADIADFDLPAYLQPEICIHLAWYGEHGAYWKSTKNFDMLSASLALAVRLSEIGCSRFVGIGTCVEYRIDQGYFSETSSILKPESSYAASKLALYYLLEQLGNTSPIETTWLRLFYLYGPGEDSRRLVPYVIRQLLAEETVETTTGEQIRDYLHVKDVASAICAVAQSTLSGAVNIGSGRPVSVRAVVEKIAAIMGRTDLLRIGARPSNPDDPPFICANAERLYSTGWQPYFDLNTGLRHTIDWWRHHEKQEM